MAECTKGHENQCLNANPESECKCSCGGEHHGELKAARIAKRAKKRIFYCIKCGANPVNVKGSICSDCFSKRSW